MDTIARQAIAAFDTLTGARLRARIPFPQSLINRMLSRSRWTVTIQSHNRLEVSHHPFRTEVEILAVTTELTFVLAASWASRAALRGLLAWKPSLHYYIGLRDGWVYVFGSRIPALARYRAVWQHLSDIRARTKPGLLVLDFDLHVSEKEPVRWPSPSSRN